MTIHYLNKWKQYLKEDDYNYLVQYIENIRNNVLNDKMIILSGQSRTGKTTLINDIKSYLGNDLCQDYFMLGDIMYNENIKKLIFICVIDEIARSKKYNTAIINLIKYKQSFIADTIHIENMDSKLLEYCKVIQMEHIF